MVPRQGADQTAPLPLTRRADRMRSGRRTRAFSGVCVMARGRMISKSLGGSKKFTRLRVEHPDVGLFAQALYPLILADTDDFGRQKADAFSVKVAAWPGAPEPEATFEQALEALRAVHL